MTGNKVLVVGGGGREHAICRALATAPGTEILVAPGNPGTAAVARSLAVGADDVAEVVRAAVAEGVDLVVPGPEVPLVAGLAHSLPPPPSPHPSPSGRTTPPKWYGRPWPKASTWWSPAPRFPWSRDSPMHSAT